MLKQDGSLRSSEYLIDSILLNLITSLMDGHSVSSDHSEFLDREFLEWELSLEMYICVYVHSH